MSCNSFDGGICTLWPTCLLTKRKFTYLLHPVHRRHGRKKRAGSGTLRVNSIRLCWILLFPGGRSSIPLELGIFWIQNFLLHHFLHDLLHDLLHVLLYCNRSVALSSGFWLIGGVNTKGVNLHARDWKLGRKSQEPEEGPYFLSSSFYSEPGNCCIDFALRMNFSPAITRGRSYSAFRCWLSTTWDHWLTSTWNRLIPRGRIWFLLFVKTDPTVLVWCAMGIRMRKKLCCPWLAAADKKAAARHCATAFCFMFLSWILIFGIEWKATWLILPVVIRSSQRLSHARLSINLLLWNCEWLIISVIVYLIVPYYLDNRSNSRANTCVNTLLG